MLQSWQQSLQILAERQGTLRVNGRSKERQGVTLSHCCQRTFHRSITTRTFPPDTPTAHQLTRSRQKLADLRNYVILAVKDHLPAVHQVREHIRSLWVGRRVDGADLAQWLASNYEQLVRSLRNSELLLHDAMCQASKSNATSCSDGENAQGGGRYHAVRRLQVVHRDEADDLARLDRRRKPFVEPCTRTHARTHARVR